MANQKEPNKQRVKLKKTSKQIKVESDVDFNEMKQEESEVKDETDNPSEKPLKRKHRTSSFVKKKRLKLDTMATKKLKTKSEDVKTEEENVGSESKKSERKPLERKCVLCKFVEIKDGKVRNQTLILCLREAGKRGWMQNYKINVFYNLFV